MKISMNWIRQYADIPVSPAEYESTMIMHGTGVEGIEYLGEECQNVVVGRVLTCRDHENSDHLHVCQVDVGEREAFSRRHVVTRLRSVMLLCRIICCRA